MDPINALWSKPHYQCAGPQADRLQQWLSQRLSADPRADFVGLAQYEHADALQSTLQEAGYATLGAGCYSSSSRKNGDVIGLAYDPTRYDLIKASPVTAQGASCTVIPQTDADSGSSQYVNCYTDQDPTLHCCNCTGDANESGVGARAFVGGVFQQHSSGKKVCVLAASLPHPVPNIPGSSTCSLDKPQSDPQGCKRDLYGNLEGAVNFSTVVKDFCAGTDEILLMADTNYSTADQVTSKFFSPSVVQLANLKDASDPGRTCCADSPDNNAAYASDRIASSGRVQAWGGFPMNDDTRAKLGTATLAPCPVPSTSPSPSYAALSQDYPCCAIGEEHLPVFATVTFE